MILRNLNVYGTKGKKAIHIENGKIKAIIDSEKKISIAQDETVIEFDDATAFPGFINSHDHLDFNLFPQLGNRVYNNYTEWGKGIHECNKDEINEVLKVPEQLRIKCGLYKNLLNGVTTVVNHGKKLKIEDDLINVVQPSSLHSPAFEKRWKWKLNNPLLTAPVVMHIGEGTDAKTKNEIDEVKRWNFLKKRIIAVHGVAMNAEQAASFYGLVWCPASNYFLLNQTADIVKLKEKTNIVFGTDSTLTAPWNLWEHFRMCKRSGVNESELITMVTSKPAQLWKLNQVGVIAEEKNADIIILRKKDDFFGLNSCEMLLFLHNGNIRLIKKSLYDTISTPPSFTKKFYEIKVDGKEFLIQGDLPGMIKEIRMYYPGFKSF